MGCVVVTADQAVILDLRGPDPKVFKTCFETVIAVDEHPIESAVLKMLSRVYRKGAEYATFSARVLGGKGPQDLIVSLILPGPANVVRVTKVLALILLHPGVDQNE
jgi:hypothetical protein